MDQQAQDAVFAWGEGHRLSVHHDTFGDIIQFDAADDETLRLLHLCSQHGVSPQLRSYPGQYLHGVKGLGDIIVSADVQPQNLIGAFAFGGQQNDGNIGSFTQFGGDGNSIQFRHHNVQQDQLNIGVLHHFQRLLAGICLKQTVVLLGRQINFQRGDDIPVIVTDQNVIHGIISCSYCTKTSFKRTGWKILKLS